MHSRTVTRSLAASAVLPFVLIVACSEPIEPDPGSETDDETEASIPAAVKLDLPITAISASGGHTCVVADTGKPYCWGANTYGELGDGTVNGSPVPVAVRAGAGFVAVSVDGFIRWPEYGVEPHPWAAYTCGLDGKGSAYCWGDMTYGQLGTGVHPCPECRWPETLIPQAVLGGPYTKLSAGDRHACALTAGGSVYCWGDRSGVSGPWNQPIQITGIPAQAVAVAAGGDHSCVLTSDADAFCWGSNRWGQIGTGAVGLHDRQTAPVRVAIADLVSVHAGDNGTCALTRHHVAYCWGRNDAGQLGNGEVRPVCVTDGNTSTCPTDPTGPQRVSGTISFTTLAVGQFHTCGLDEGGRAYCWGSAEQSGRQTGASTVPGPVDTDRRFRDIAAGARHTCAITLEGTVYCWGDGHFGQLGNGSRTSSLYPVAIANRD